MATAVTRQVFDGPFDVRNDVALGADPANLAERYVALWNEPDAERRRAMIRELWAPQGEHLLEPPRELREAAAALGFGAPALAIRGYGALESRVARAYDEFVSAGEYIFRPCDNAAGIRNLVKFNWEMDSTATGDVAGVGLEVLELDDQGRILTDYQFIEARTDEQRQGLHEDHLHRRRWFRIRRRRARAERAAGRERRAPDACRGAFGEWRRHFSPQRRL
jgi:hypothetical protein